jgi:phosphate transport system substrate-binding protein
MVRRALALAVIATIASAGTAEARDQIRIVGSSTVFPFATRVAEEFGRTTAFKTPVIESTGSGGGFKLFCQGVGIDTPDISDASRAIAASEFAACQRNGVEKITEVKIGYDGIVLANSKAAPKIDITLKDLYLALAKDVPDGKGGAVPNPYHTWSEIDPTLPQQRIEVLGPPPTSGTRDAFVELAMDVGCNAIPGMAELKASDAKRHAAICGAIREDGAYIEAGENDVLIVRKLEANPNAFGIFGYSFLDENRDRIQGSKINGIEDSYDTIATGTYPLARPLYFYVKDQHVGVVPGIREYIQEFTSDKAWGPEGYLADKGLIALPDAERVKWRKVASELVNNVSMPGPRP